MKQQPQRIELESMVVRFKDRDNLGETYVGECSRPFSNKNHYRFRVRSMKEDREVTETDELLGSVGAMADPINVAQCLVTLYRESRRKERL